ncbi:MAG: hypothetical protein ACJ73W_03325 [Rubrobacteraceae bacterium]
MLVGGGYPRDRAGGRGHTLTPRNPLVVVENLAARWYRAGGRRSSDHFRSGGPYAPRAGSGVLAPRRSGDAF